MESSAGANNFQGQATFLFLLLHVSASLRAMAPAHSFTFVAPCQPFATSSPVPNQPGCFSFSATNGGASDPNGYYSWDFGDGTTAVGPTAVHCYTPNLIINHYTVTVTYNSTLVCGSAPMRQSHEAHVIPNTPTGVELQGLLTACRPQG